MTIYLFRGEALGVRKILSLFYELDEKTRMRRILLVCLVTVLPLSSVFGEVVVDDDFSGGMLDPVVWNHGGGFFLTDNENVLLSTFGSGWGSKGDQTGAAGLNSAVGYASFSVADDGTNPLGGNFNIGKDLYSNTAQALARVNFGGPLGGAGTYELVWNNSGVDGQMFEMGISGWSGTIAGNSFVWIRDGDTDNPVWGTTDAAPNVDVGDAANRFGFWLANSDQNAIIDNVVVWDALTSTSSGPGCDFDLSGDCGIDDLNLLLSEGPIAGGVAVTVGTNDQFDLNNDGSIDLADRDIWLADAATENGLGSPYLVGDANLDGVADVSDFNVWNSNKFSGVLAWNQGDFNGDGVADVSDFNSWNANKFLSSDTAAVPEPAGFCLVGIGLTGIALGRRSIQGSIGSK